MNYWDNCLKPISFFLYFLDKLNNFIYNNKYKCIYFNSKALRSTGKTLFFNFCMSNTQVISQYGGII